MPPPNRKLNGPVMIPVSEKYNDMGTVVVGKVESGRVRKGDTLVIMPNHITVEVIALYNEMEDEITAAFAGDNIRLRLRGVDDKDISPGFVITSVYKPVRVVKQFIAQLAILEHKNIICAGYSAVMHMHTLSEEVALLVGIQSRYLFLAYLFGDRNYCTILTKKLANDRRSPLNSPRRVCGYVCSIYVMTYARIRHANHCKDRNDRSGVRRAVQGLSSAGPVHLARRGKDRCDGEGMFILQSLFSELQPHYSR
jgi:selenocysteine-specific translation elongation factor